jgi:hypothetical protein
MTERSSYHRPVVLGRVAGHLKVEARPSPPLRRQRRERQRRRRRRPQQEYALCLAQQLHQVKPLARLLFVKEREMIILN